MAKSSAKDPVDEEIDDEDEDEEEESIPAREFLSRAYLQVDPRALAVFRVGMGLLLLGDLVRHVFGLRDWYFPGSVIPQSFIIGRGNPPFSIFLLVENPVLVVAIFALFALVFAAYTVGWRTRLMQVLAFAAIVSLHGRAEMTEHAGERSVHLFLLITIFLPLGRRWSLDALLARVKTPDTAPVRSVAMAVMSVQLIAAYTLDFLVKGVGSWQNGTAILASTSPLTASLPGIWLRDHLPFTLFVVLTTVTLMMEQMIPVLLLLPVPLARWSSGILMILLHVGIRTFMDLGVFQYAMILPGVLFFPPAFWDWLEESPRVAPLRHRLARVSAALRARAATLPRRRRVPLKPWVVQAQEAGMGVIGLALGVLVLSENHLITQNPRVPEVFKLDREMTRPLREFIVRFGIFETWEHYANPQFHDAMLVVDAVTVDGRHVDPVNYAAWGHLQPVEAVPHDRLGLAVLWWNFTKVTHDPRARPLRPLRDWVLRFHERTGNPSDRIVSYRIFWLSTARDFAGNMGETERRLLMSSEGAGRPEPD